ncbi:TPA: hypothetical protein N0F65_012981 [Lagenidium giganteum]|uniref:SelT-like protein n=1 Tax=Lagenidium giganteum TaxID=4803 RepID=A0AAV2YF32_9STRA|nr:TPA: hypothetical protein N0F65_012981 [Lagenidium giganteum]
MCRGHTQRVLHTISINFVWTTFNELPAGGTGQEDRTRMATMTRATKLKWLRMLVLLVICLLAGPGMVQPTTAAKKESSATTTTTSAKRDITLDHVNVFFCTSCGFQQNFMEVKKFLENRYPHLVDRVYGANHQPDPMKKVLADFLGYLQLGGIAMLIVGERIFTMFGADTTLLQKALDNKLMCFSVILLLGSISQSILSTGAFEIYFNDELVFSKLAAGRWPSLEEIQVLFDARVGDLASP